MTKQKTKKGVLKRIKITKSGKVRRYPSKKGHFRVEKSGKKRRNLKKPLIISGKIAKNFKELIGR